MLNSASRSDDSDNEEIYAMQEEEKETSKSKRIKKTKPVVDLSDLDDFLSNFNGTYADYVFVREEGNDSRLEEIINLLLTPLNDYMVKARAKNSATGTFVGDFLKIKKSLTSFYVRIGNNTTNVEKFYHFVNLIVKLLGLLIKSLKKQLRFNSAKHCSSLATDENLRILVKLSNTLDLCFKLKWGDEYTVVTSYQQQ